jgi:cytochrome c biogenesis protein CcmG/thiol:disulfide interchange protein DsbE
MIRRTRAGLGLAALLVAGCGEMSLQPPTVGEPLADLSLVSTVGESHSLSELRGDPFLVNLWATWCPPCRAETPLLQSLYEEHRDAGFQVVGITVDNAGARASVDRFLAEHDVSYLQLLDPQMNSMDRYGVVGLPASYLVDRDGIVRFVRLGPILEEDPDFQSALAQVLEPAQ